MKRRFSSKQAKTAMAVGRARMSSLKLAWQLKYSSAGGPRNGVDFSTTLFLGPITLEDLCNRVYVVHPLLVGKHFPIPPSHKRMFYPGSPASQATEAAYGHRVRNRRPVDASFCSRQLANVGCRYFPFCGRGLRQHEVIGGSRVNVESIDGTFVHE
jgi:hypothetical protein